MKYNMKFKLSMGPALESIKCPVVVGLDGKEQRFENGAVLSEAEFSEPYDIVSVDVRDGAIVLTLKERELLPLDWANGKPVSFF